MKISFKTTKPTGKYKAFHSSYHEIKIDGQVCGNIEDEKPHKIWLKITKADISEDGNQNCLWKRIVLKHEANSVIEQQDWFKENIDKIAEKYTIHITD